jgi:hypothetical protein
MRGPMETPRRDCRRLAVVTITGHDGTRRTIATNKAADLMSVGIMVRTGRRRRRSWPRSQGGSLPGRRAWWTVCGGWWRKPETHARKRGACSSLRSQLAAAPVPTASNCRDPRRATAAHAAPARARVAHPTRGAPCERRAIPAPPSILTGAGGVFVAITRREPKRDAVDRRHRDGQITCPSGPTGSAGPLRTVRRSDRQPETPNPSVPSRSSSARRPLPSPLSPCGPRRGS